MSFSNPEFHSISPHLRIVKKRPDRIRDDIDMMSWEELEQENTPREKEKISLADRLESMRDLLGFYEDRVAFLEQQKELFPENRIWAEKSGENQPSTDLIEREINHLRGERIPEVRAKIQKLEAELEAGQDTMRPRAVNE